MNLSTPETGRSSLQPTRIGVGGLEAGGLLGWDRFFSKSGGVLEDIGGPSFLQTRATRNLSLRNPHLSGYDTRDEREGGAVRISSVPRLRVDISHRNMIDTAQCASASLLDKNGDKGG